MGRAEEPSRYDAAAETRQFSDPDRGRFTDPVTRRPGHVPYAGGSADAPETRLVDPVPDRPGQQPGPDPHPDPSRVWEQSDEPGHTHDPHEVTVQLDGVGRELEDWLVQQAKEAPAPQESDGPVFVDESGRRRSRLRRIGIVVGLACAVYAVVIGATLLSGNSNAPWLPGLGQQDEEPASEVEAPPLPADSAGPSGTASVSPSAGTSPTAGTTTAPVTGTSPSGEASAPAAPGSPKPSVSDEPDPGPTTEDPGVDPQPSRPDPSDPVTSPDPEPSTSESTGTDGGTGTGTGTDSDPVAGDAPAPGPVGSGAAPSSSSSPENIA
ncbi:hypothetical protein [Streptomyces sp. NPDC046862]|uniref:hypothetical protein n=1 Tax=Streptomyces sp. NPDC046862 TaxID=3154603 RepID=UPI003452117A